MKKARSRRARSPRRGTCPAIRVIHGVWSRLMSLRRVCAPADTTDFDSSPSRGGMIYEARPATVSPANIGAPANGDGNFHLLRNSHRANIVATHPTPVRLISIPFTSRTLTENTKTRSVQPFPPSLFGRKVGSKPLRRAKGK